MRNSNFLVLFLAIAHVQRAFRAQYILQDSLKLQ